MEAGGSVCLLVHLLLTLYTAAGLPFTDQVVQFDQGGGGSPAGQNWVFLVAGSGSYAYYRHQADVFHAYHVVKKHGIPEDHIILMTRDDVAWNEQNPTPGIVLNHPRGPDVYEGVKVACKKLLPDNFLAILEGNTTKLTPECKNSSVIKSGPNDNIFVNFVGTALPGMISFFDGSLNAKDLTDAFKRMHENKKYKQLVFYVETSFAGQLFDKLLPKDINVFVTTASNETEVSYACYFDQERNTYLGDVYSIKWMEDSDVEDLQKETLQDQYMTVKKHTNTSHVQEYGDMSMGSLPVADFQGGMGYAPKMRNTIYNNEHRQPSDTPPDPCMSSAMPSHSLPVTVLKHKLSNTKNKAETVEIKTQIQNILHTHGEIEATIQRVVAQASSGPEQEDRVRYEGHRHITDWHCHTEVIQAFHHNCFNLNLAQHEIAHSLMYMLVNLCEEGVGIDAIQQAIHTVCH